MNKLNQNSIDTEVLQSLKEFGGDDIIENLSSLFFDTVPPKLSSLKQAIEDQNSQLVFETAHYLKSTGSNLGLTTFSETAKIIETNARKEDLSLAKDHYLALDAAMKEASSYLKTMIPK